MNKVWYRVAPGVTRVNGSPVQPGARIRLSKAEAAYDISLGRISLDKQQRAAKAPRLARSAS